MPTPVRLLGVIRGDRLPDHRVAQRANAEAREPVEILGPARMTRLEALVAEGIADARDGAFDAAPKLERPCWRKDRGHRHLKRTRRLSLRRRARRSTSRRGGRRARPAPARTR